VVAQLEYRNCGLFSETMSRDRLAEGLVLLDLRDFLFRVVTRATLSHKFPRRDSLGTTHIKSLREDLRLLSIHGAGLGVSLTGYSNTSIGRSQWPLAGRVVSRIFLAVSRDPQSTSEVLPSG
jgi:hypothetical protein